jgi:hypothetical protein
LVFGRQLSTGQRAPERHVGERDRVPEGRFHLVGRYRSRLRLVEPDLDVGGRFDLGVAHRAQLLRQQPVQQRIRIQLAVLLRALLGSAVPLGHGGERLVAVPAAADLGEPLAAAA